MIGWCAALLMIDCLIDLSSTAYLLNHGATEANPILAYILVRYGIPLFAAFKVLITAIGVYVLTRCKASRVMFVSCFGMTVLCMWMLIHVAQAI